MLTTFEMRALKTIIQAGIEYPVGAQLTVVGADRARWLEGTKSAEFVRHQTAALETPTPHDEPTQGIDDETRAETPQPAKGRRRRI